jgi:hypothetical protein
VFRQTWDALQKRLSPRRADIAYLRILKLAARGLETDVTAVLEELLASKQVWDDQTVADRVYPQQSKIPDLKINPVNLQEYDRLLSREVCCDPA